MHLNHLKLLNFKNYEDLELTFSEQINCFVGDNGTGKTNLLDAIHYLSLTRSAFNRVDAQNIRHGADYFAVHGRGRFPDRSHLISCALRQGEKKVVSLDRQPYERLSDHLGRFPVVLLAPDDTDLIRGGSEDRRRFFDATLAQTDADYLTDLMRYNRLLSQRNSLLKQFAERRYVDNTLLAAYGEPLADLAEAIYRCRRAFLTDFTALFHRHYRHLSEGREAVTLRYASGLDPERFPEPFVERLRAAVPKDLALQRTTLGVHRDDFEFELGSYPLKKVGSQGQQKSFVIALRLAQFDSLRAASGARPALLLDDIFDKLDERRVRHLMELVADRHFGQIFLTDARPDRTAEIFANLDAEVRIFQTSLPPHPTGTLPSQTL